MTIGKLRRKRLHLAMFGAVLVIVASACNPVFGTPSGPVRRATLTSPSGDVYAYAGDATNTVVTPTTGSTDGNIREVAWHTGSLWAADQQTCVDWNTVAYSQGGEPTQPGLAMRINRSGANNEGFKAITINENIVFAGVWIMWVNTWDTTRGAVPYQGVESFDLSPIVGKIWVDDNGVAHSTLVPAPWHVCGRTAGSSLTFKVWTGDNPEPSWDDPGHVFTTTLPSGWDYPGFSGTYMGHLHDGQTASFANFSSVPYCPGPDVNSPGDCTSQAEGTSTSTSSTVVPPG